MRRESGDEKPLDVGVGAEPSAVANGHRVDGADARREGIDLIGARHQADLERGRDAHAAHAHMGREGDEVVRVARLERHVHRVQPERREARVVHDRRPRVNDRVADDGVERGVGGDAAEPEIPLETGRGDLTRRDAVAGIRPPVAQSRGQHPRRQTLVSHRDEDVAMVRLVGVRPAPRSKSGKRLGERRHLNGELRDFGASRAHGRVAIAKIRWRGAEDVRRHDDAPARDVRR